MSRQNTEPDLWSPQGVYARHFPGYQPRPQQLQLHHQVEHTLQAGGALIAEAGTGCGKSLAYLTPAIRAAVRDNIQILVTTATINLQEQLMRKDIPNAVRALEQDGVIPKGSFRYAALKGQGNYLCRHNYEAARQRGTASAAADSLMAKIAAWRTNDGDRAGLALGPGEYGPWLFVSAQFHTHCPYYDDHRGCYLQQARTQASDAHLVVANHALYLADLDNGGHQLGHIKHVIIDEAHKLEEVASSQFGWELNRDQALEQINPLLNDPVLAETAYRLAGAWERFWQTLAQNLPEARGQHDIPQTVITPQIRRTAQWQRTQQAAQLLGEATGRALSALRDEQQRARRQDDSFRMAQMEPLADTASAHMGAVNSMTARHNPDHVQWLDRNDRHGVTIHSTPIDVAPLLKEHIFDRVTAAVLTSATLAAGAQDFGHTRQALGFPADGRQLQLLSPFDYPNQARLSIPTDLPDPRQWREHNNAVARTIADLAVQLDGHTLALFTSYQALNHCAKMLREPLSEAGIRILAQGQYGRPESIIEEYRQNPNVLILGTASFWEGVDLDDPPLRAVAICRLPFPVPADPVVNARSQRFENPFRDYHQPAAILRFRQGCGRLIRSTASKGSVVVLDPRIVNARYGADFIASLPDYSIGRHPADRTGAEARRWIAEA